MSAAGTDGGTPVVEPAGQTDWRRVAELNLVSMNEVPLIEQQQVMVGAAQAAALIALVDSVDRLIEQVQKVTGP